jgi:hypothetical protein
VLALIVILERPIQGLEFARRHRHGKAAFCDGYFLPSFLGQRSDRNGKTEPSEPQAAEGAWERPVAPSGDAGIPQAISPINRA